MSGYFITGTDTEVGKSVVTAALAAGFRAQGRVPRAVKPLASGSPPRVKTPAFSPSMRSTIPSALPAFRHRPHPNEPHVKRGSLSMTTDSWTGAEFRPGIHC